MIDAIREQVTGLQAKLKALDKKLASKHADGVPGLMLAKLTIFLDKTDTTLEKQDGQLAKALKDAEDDATGLYGGQGKQ